jgi:hypothetical protein
MKEIMNGLGAIVASTCLVAAAGLLWVTIHLLKGVALAAIGITAAGFLLGASPSWLSPWLIVATVALIIIGDLAQDLPSRLLNRAVSVTRQATTRPGERG